MELSGLEGFGGWYPFELTGAVFGFPLPAPIVTEEPVAGELRALGLAIDAPPPPWAAGPPAEGTETITFGGLAEAAVGRDACGFGNAYLEGVLKGESSGLRVSNV